ncbi:hypothetical protein LINPERPRIM_LOCUS21095 [Linum perenne]
MISLGISSSLYQKEDIPCSVL